MNVLVITGSAHKTGTSATLAESFIKGAEEAGHTVFRFDSAFKKIHPCIGCEKCHTTNTGCAFKDDMEELNPHMLEADVIVFASPVYYYAMNAQIKAVIDRFYANDSALHKNKRAVLLLTMADNSEETANGAAAAFKGMAKFLEWDIAGIISAINCPVVDVLNKTDYPKQAYELGKSL